MFNNRKLGRVLFTIPHSSARARMTTVVELPEDPETVRIVVKGAPEILIQKCARTFTAEGAIDALDESEKDAIIDQFLNKDWTNYSIGPDGQGSGNAYRSILYAYTDVPKADFEGNRQATNDFASEEDKSLIESDLTLVGIFALDNPLREKVARAVRVGTQGHLTIRMVSGDSEGTARAVAIQAGILHPTDLNKPNAVISGAQFREAVGGIGMVVNEDGSETIGLKNPSAFAGLANEVKVIYRATAQDKLALVTGLKTWADKHSARGRSVAVTGEGVNDESALKMADVGFAMGGSGCDIAKEASSVILTDDNFSNSIKTAMWGRNIYQNIRKFLQFQATVNISCCLVVLLSAITLGVAAFGVVQLIYINLVMDIFAALALATEPPRTMTLKYKPVKDGDAVMQKSMWLQIFGVGTWITLITMIFLWAGPNIWFGKRYPYGSVSDTISFDAATMKEADWYHNDGILVDDPVKHVHGFAFLLFMVMHMFNEIACRKVSVQDFNMFERFFNNFLFTFIMIGQAVALWAMFSFAVGQKFMKLQPISSVQWGTALLFGCSVLLVSTLLKLVPEKFLDRIPSLIDESKNCEDDPTMKLFNKASKGGVGVKLFDDANEGPK
jgi:magnesium-transporting ATPase (P-type)